MAADPYRAPAPEQPPAREPAPITASDGPHVERLPDGSRVLRKCRPPGYWDRWGKFADGDIWECPVCFGEFRFVSGWFIHFWLQGWKPTPGETKAEATARSRAQDRESVTRRVQAAKKRAAQHKGEP